MKSEINVKVSNVSLYVRVIKVTKVKYSKEVVLKNSVVWDIASCS
jgi:hypothetical protein